MKDCLIVFDTNAYRTFIPNRSEEDAKSKISKLINLEESNNIKALLATDVAVELYSHLADLNDEYYNICKNSVIAQFKHCLYNDVTRNIMNSDVHLCNIVFGKLPEFSIEEQNKILRMSESLYLNSSHEYLEGYTNNFKGIAKFSDDKKRGYMNKIKDIFQYHIKLSDKNDPPSIAESLKLKEELKKLKEELESELSINKLANRLVDRAAITLNINLESISEFERNEKVEIIRSQFLVPIFYYRNNLKNIINSIETYNFDDPKKGNDYWDYQLTFQIGNEVNGNKIIFVTDDGKIHTASKEAGLSDRVIKLNDYLRNVGFSSPSFNSDLKC